MKATKQNHEPKEGQSPFDRLSASYPEYSATVHAALYVAFLCAACIVYLNDKFPDAAAEWNASIGNISTSPRDLVAAVLCGGYDPRRE